MATRQSKPATGDATAEQALRRSEERHVLVTQASTDGIYDWDIRTNTLEVSQRLNEIIGHEDAEFISENWADRVHPDDLGGYRDAIVRHFKAETPRLACEYRLRRKSMDYIWVSDNGICTRDEAGRAVRLVGAISDITSRKLAELGLQSAREDAERARRQMTDAMESVSEGIVLFDREDRVIMCNENYRRYFADAAGEEVAAMVRPGAMFWDFFREANKKRMFPDLPEENFEAYIAGRKAMRGNPRQAVEQHLSDGRWLQINERKTADGGIASIYTDITELKRRETELAEKTEMLEGLSGKLSKYLSPQVYSSIFSGEQGVGIASKRKKLTVFFSDIEDFTATADILESEELTSLLNQYLTEMSKIALAHGATIDKYIGDAILVFFGDPESKGAKEDAVACVRMAVAMQRRMRDLQTEWRERGLEQTFRQRIGVNTGYCTVGNFGSEDRMDYTVVGNTVNMASRLQQRAEPDGILLAGETYSLVKETVLAEPQGSIEVKGIPRPVQTYKVIGIYDELAEEGRVIHAETPGLSLTVDRAKLSGRERKAAIKALEDAAARLRLPNDTTA